MAVFEIEAGGKVYEVEAPDMQTAAGAFKNFTPSKPVSTVEDVAKSYGTGLVKGAAGLAGTVGDMQRLGARAGQWLGSKITGNPAGPANSAAFMPGSTDILGAVQGVAGPLYKPQTTVGEYAQTMGEFTPAAAFPARGAVGRALNVALPALASETAGQATKGTAAEPWARVGAGVAGALAPNMLSRVVTPLPASAERARMVQALEQEGVTGMTAGQRTGSNSLRYMESALGDAPFAGGQAQRAERTAREQFTSAALRRAGINEGQATPEVLAQNQQRLGGVYDTLAQRGQVVPDQRFVNDVTQTAQRYATNVLPTHRSGGTQNIQGIVGDIIDVMQQNGGVMPGRIYQAERSRLTGLADAARQNDPELARALRGIRDALDNAFDRSLSPADRALRAQTNRQYAAQKILEKVASRAGEATGEGMIVPANLRNEVASQNRGAYARGQGDFAELSRAGATVMTPMPQSGTAPRSMVYNLANLLTGGLAPAAAGRALMSRPVQGYLGNQLMPGVDPYALQRSLATGVLGRPDLMSLPPPRQ